MPVIQKKPAKPYLLAEIHRRVDAKGVTGYRIQKEAGISSYAVIDRLLKADESPLLANVEAVIAALGGKLRIDWKD